MIEKLRRLQRALKESQKMYLAEQGKVVLRWYQDYKQNKATVRELEEQLKETAELFGKDLNEVIE
jgi:lysyl-tRNA synthetase class I